MEYCYGKYIKNKELRTLCNQVEAVKDTLSNIAMLLAAVEHCAYTLTQSNDIENISRGLAVTAEVVEKMLLENTEFLENICERFELLEK